EVPEKYEFLNESNQYQLNKLTKFLFEKYGFKAFLASEEKPMDWNNMICNILHADVIDDSGLFQTKLQLVLKDCKNEEVFTSKTGSSKEKDFKLAYHEALRDAFSSFEAVKYSYDQNLVIEKSKATAKEVEKEIYSIEENIQKESKEVIVSAIPQVTKETSKIKKSEPITSGPKVYVSGNIEFYLLETEFGYQLFLKQIDEPFAKLVKTKSANHFIYSTIQNQGIAYFDVDGNLSVEILNAQDNSTSIKIYVSKN
ncbi:MAG TPA: hypothetical protein VK833_05810, partial [Gillisia sp.]|nr:hypothetical protein [Gillisia sp.]